MRVPASGQTALRVSCDVCDPCLIGCERRRARGQHSSQPEAVKGERAVLMRCRQRGTSIYILQPGRGREELYKSSWSSPSLLDSLSNGPREGVRRGGGRQ